jgi:hypothetical protein
MNPYFLSECPRTSSQIYSFPILTTLLSKLARIPHSQDHGFLDNVTRTRHWSLLVSCEPQALACRDFVLWNVVSGVGALPSTYPAEGTEYDAFADEHICRARAGRRDPPRARQRIRFHDASRVPGGRHVFASSSRPREPRGRHDLPRGAGPHD